MKSAGFREIVHFCFLSIPTSALVKVNFRTGEKALDSFELISFHFMLARDISIKAVTSCSTHKIDQQETDG